MTEWLIVLGLCGVSTLPTDGGATACRDKDLVEQFVEYANNSLDLHSPGGLREAFRPYAATIEGCLKRWVEDGGEQDGVPLSGRYGNREHYRSEALLLLGQLFPKNEAVASWVRSRMAAWPPDLQRDAVNTLAWIRAPESFAFLKAKAQKSGDQKDREQIWRSLLLIDPERFAEELESIAPTREEQLALGEFLISWTADVVGPALRKLRTLIPERASKYDEHIRHLEKSDADYHAK